MALSSSQLRVARFLHDLARRRGLGEERAWEFAAAAAAESGLSPSATNKSSGAAGLFQLLSAGYRQRAQKLGGLYDPRANALAILPDYVSYWRAHPGARPGEAGRDVERSGQGANFYAAPLASVRQAAGVPPLMPGSSPSPNGAMTSVRRPVYGVDRAAANRGWAEALLGGGLSSPQGLLQALAQRQQLLTPRVVGHTTTRLAAPAQTSGGTAEPAGDEHGGTLMWLRRYARPYRLTITSTNTGDHVRNSYHYSNRAIDLGGSPQRMAAIAADALKHPKDFVEMFYTGPGNPGFFIKNGVVYPDSQLDRSVATGHRNHVHLAR